MTIIIIFVLLAMGSFLYWFGYEVTSGKHKASPNDHFFPLLGRNIDYVVGLAGIPLAIAMFILAFGVWADIRQLNYVAAVFVLAGVIRAYLPPAQFGPVWYRNKSARTKANNTTKKSTQSRKKRKK